MALSQREKRLLVVPVLIGGVLAFYNWVHEPLFARRAEAAAQQEQVSTELTRDQSRLNKEGNLQSRKQAVAAREKVIDAWVPGKNSAALFIWYLSQAEMHSGARITGITVGDRKQVTPTQPGTAPAQPPANSAQPPANSAQPPANPAPSAGQPAPAPGADTAPTLTVVNLELKVQARFAQHLLFNQAMEEMPLFLNTDSLSMAKNSTSPAEQVGKLLQQGNSVMAAQVLSASPNLDGVYHIALYFKGDKLGPTTDAEQFAEGAGRMDPFAMSGVDEFVNTLVQAYSGKTPVEVTQPSGATPGLPEQQSGEMG